MNWKRWLKSSVDNTMITRTISENNQINRKTWVDHKLMIQTSGSWRFCVCSRPTISIALHWRPVATCLLLMIGQIRLKSLFWTHLAKPRRRVLFEAFVSTKLISTSFQLQSGLTLLLQMLLTLGGEFTQVENHSQTDQQMSWPISRCLIMQCRLFWSWQKQNWGLENSRSYDDFSHFTRAQA